MCAMVRAFANCSTSRLGKTYTGEAVYIRKDAVARVKGGL